MVIFQYREIRAKILHELIFAEIKGIKLKRAARNAKTPEERERIHNCILDNESFLNQLQDEMNSVVAE